MEFQNVNWLHHCLVGNLRTIFFQKVRPPFKGLDGVCQLHSYYFDFYLGGWDDWILSPSGFQANLCFGFCPHHMPEHMNTTNNAIIQRLMHSTNPEV
jgi:hypothetical protein